MLGNEANEGRCWSQGLMWCRAISMHWTAGILWFWHLVRAIFSTMTKRVLITVELHNFLYHATVCCWWVHMTSSPGNQPLVLLQQPPLIIPLLLHFWSFPVFDSYSTHPHASKLSQNSSMRHTEPRRSISDHPWSQDSPYLVHDGYQVIFIQVFWSISK